MSLRILHTADNHIGLSFQQYPEVARERLIAERFASLERLVTTANERKADFFVVAGDLFDKTSVTKAQVERGVQILGKFKGEAVLVLAGNHDFCEEPDTKLWKQVRNAADGSRVLALTEPATCDFESDDYRVLFHACPCPSQHGKEQTVGWVADQERPSDRLHVGIAHGNVEGLGLDADQRYFNMADSDFQKAGVQTWLLWHIPVPAPAPGTTGKPLYFMPGIHADSGRGTPLHSGKLRPERKACRIPARPNPSPLPPALPYPNSTSRTWTASSSSTTLYRHGQHLPRRRHRIHRDLRGKPPGSFLYLPSGSRRGAIKQGRCPKSECAAMMEPITEIYSPIVRRLCHTRDSSPAYPGVGECTHCHLHRQNHRD